MKMKTGFKTFFAATVILTGLSACHSSANDNTSRPCVPDVNGDNIGNDEIIENRSMGNDANPNNKMWDGVTTPEERIGDTPACCEKKDDTKMHSGHEEH